MNENTQWVEFPIVLWMNVCLQKKGGSIYRDTVQFVSLSLSHEEFFVRRFGSEGNAVFAACNDT